MDLGLMNDDNDNIGDNDDNYGNVSKNDNDDNNGND